MTPGVLPEATVFAGRYRVVRCIAVGGMGAVYEAIHVETERRRALKVMHPQLIQSEDMRSRFRQEARVAAKIESLHIVDVFDAGIDEATGMPFLVMELLRGEELGKRLKRVKRFAPADVVLYLHQASLALDKTHRAQIVHRDLKPDNLFLCERDEGPPCIKVLDFGIAKLVAEGSTQANATRSLGTPLYMAPEQFRPPTLVAPATDIFALGMIAYTLLVGTAYWLEDSIASGNVFAFAATAGGGPQEAASARALRRGVVLPPSFDVWFARATALTPADRFSTASAAVHALAHAFGLPRPGQEPYAPAAVGAFAMSYGASSTGSDATTELPPSFNAPAGRAAPVVPFAAPLAPAAAFGPVPAPPAASSRGSGADLRVPGPSAVMPSSAGPPQPPPPSLSVTPVAAGLTATPMATRRGSSGGIAIAAGAMLILAAAAVGSAILFFKPRALISSSEPAAAALPTAEPVVEPQGAPAAPGDTPAQTAAIPPAPTPPSPSATPPSPTATPPSPSATPPSPPSLSATPPPTSPPAIRPTGTNTLPPAKKSGIYRRD